MTGIISDENVYINFMDTQLITIMILKISDLSTPHTPIHIKLTLFEIKGDYKNFDG